MTLRTPFPRWQRLAALVLCAALAGCSLFGPSVPISYYRLTPTTPVGAALPPFGAQIVAVQTVRLPEYLSQNGIVTRTAANEIHIARDSQWAGPLDSNATNVVVSDLAKLLASSKVVAFPISAALPVDRVVHIDVSQFEAATDGTVTLAAQWTLFADGGRTYLTTDAATYTTQIGDTAYATITAAMSELLGSLSWDIASSLVAMQGSGSPLAAAAP